MQSASRCWKHCHSAKGGGSRQGVRGELREKGEQLVTADVRVQWPSDEQISRAFESGANTAAVILKSSLKSTK